MKSKLALGHACLMGILTFAMLMTHSVQAATITYHFSGAISNITSTGVPVTSVSIGDPWSMDATITIAPAWSCTAGLLTGCGQVSSYRQDIHGQFQVGGFSYTANFDGASDLSGLQIINNAPSLGDYFSLGLDVQGVTDVRPMINGYFASQGGMLLRDITGMALPSTSLLDTISMNLGDFGTLSEFKLSLFNATDFYNPKSATIRGSINAWSIESDYVAPPPPPPPTPVVPIPAAAWLFGSGLLGLISAAKRKKAV